MSRKAGRRAAAAGGAAERADASPVDAAPVDGSPVSERDVDAVVQRIGERPSAEPDPADPEQARFFDWWARELRARQGTAERADADARAAAFARGVGARLAARRLRIASVAGSPRARVPSVAGTVLEATAAAARERAAVVVDFAVAAGVGRELWDEPAERWVALPDEMADGRHVALTVAGDSMEPALHAGDVVLVRLGPECARGTVVVARRPDDGYVVKRVGAVTRREVELTSLNPAYPPVRIPRDERLVVGTVVLRWCAHGGA
jgi:SOS-response transcriptional repressor LexA